MTITITSIKIYFTVYTQIKEMIVEVLTSQEVSGSPGPYIPTFYLEKGLHICPIEASKVR